MVIPFFRTGATADNPPHAIALRALVLQSDIAEQDLAPAWQQYALCVSCAGEVDFFPARGESVRDAKAVCTACPVRSECLEFALRLKVAHGVWGGLSERERRTLRRDRRRSAVADRG